MSVEIEKCAYDHVHERQLYMLELKGAVELPPEFAFESPYFACVLCWDATNITAETVAAVVEPLIAAGCVYFVCWGPDCERVHDIIDECDPYTDAVIMTTWHANVPIKEALWYFLNCTWPDERFEDSFKAGLAITIGSDEWATAARYAVTEPATFTQVVADDEDYELFAKSAEVVDEAVEIAREARKVPHEGQKLRDEA